MAFALSTALAAAWGAPAAVAADRNAAEVAGDVSAVLLTANDLAAALDDKIIQDKLEPAKTAAGWKWLLYPKKRESTAKKAGVMLKTVSDRLRRNSHSQSAQTENRSQAREIEVLKSEAEKRRMAGMDLGVYDQMCDELAVLLEEKLKKQVAERKPHQDKVAVVLGGLSYTPYAGSQPDLKMEKLLRDVVKQLRKKKGLQESVAFLSYNSDNARDLINKIGGDSSNWLSEDGRNYRDLDVQKFHPDDIYILSGSISEYFADYKMRYHGDFVLGHPRSQGAQGGETIDISKEVWFHPTRGFITLDEDAALADAVK